MANSRKDSKGRNLRTGESQRPDGRYEYKYKGFDGKRKTIYSMDLVSLREKEKQIQKDMDEGINTKSAEITLNEQFKVYLSTKSNLRDTTMHHYLYMWDNALKESLLGEMPIGKIKKSHILKLYTDLSSRGFKNGTIHDIHHIISPTLQLAVDDDVIRKNPCVGCLENFKKSDAAEKLALTEREQEIFLSFVRNSMYETYYPLFRYMIGTASRCSETFGLTWDDVDMKERTVSINHQLIYKKMKDKCTYICHLPKTNKGKRVIPMTEDVFNALREQRQLQFLMNNSCMEEIEGLSNFVFTNKNGMPYKSSNLNATLYRIVDKYNSKEMAKAKKEKRDPELLPRISEHILRHTGCTRMAERGIDLKALQYIMGHEKIETTMNIYNHVDMNRVSNEIKKMDNKKVI